MPSREQISLSRENNFTKEATADSIICRSGMLITGYRAIGRPAPDYNNEMTRDDAWPSTTPHSMSRLHFYCQRIHFGYTSSHYLTLIAKSARTVISWRTLLYLLMMMT